MHWLERYRMRYRRGDGRRGISRKELAQMVQTRGRSGKPESAIGCSELLIGILEMGGVTHPEIANRIAEVTGATPRQRDMLVNKIHRGKWPDDTKNAAKKYVGAHGGNNAREVVRIDRQGFETGRYASGNAAGVAMGIRGSCVNSRCHRRCTKVSEFETYGCTWRFADEWDAMSPEERFADVHRDRS